MRMRSLGIAPVGMIATAIIALGLAACGGGGGGDPTTGPPPVQNNDSDNDGIANATDNCPNTANTGQEDLDGDSLGDVCDYDDDADGVDDSVDNCPIAANADQSDSDMDALGNACDEDDDNDGVLDVNDIDKDGDRLIEIATLEQLDWMRNDLSGQSLIDHDGNVITDGCHGNVCNGYELVADLDFDTNADGQMDASDAYFDYDGDGSNAGWLPIGFGSGAFSSNFEGNGYRISNLFINRPNNSIVGLFGLIADDGSSLTEVRNLTLEGDLMSVTSGGETGGLAGGAVTVTILNVAVSGEVNGGTGVGGLVGAAGSDATITNSSSSANVNGSSLTGGLIGQALGITIRDSRATGVLTSGSVRVGGLVGEASGTTIINCSASGDVISNVSRNVSEVGGLVGAAFADTTITSSSASGAVTGSRHTGGLVGNALQGAVITDSSASGPVTGDFQNTGGLVGTADSDVRIDESLASSDVTGADTFTGGLVGFARRDVTITDSSATGTVSAGNQAIGGLVGYAIENVAIRGSSARGNVTVRPNPGRQSAGLGAAGGLVGVIRQGGEISGSFATGDVTSMVQRTQAEAGYGGLVGIVNQYFGPPDDEFVDISMSFSTGRVMGNLSQAGGLIGSAANLRLRDCYSTGSVETQDNAIDIGGLIGQFRDEIRNQSEIRWCFSAASISGGFSPGALIGTSDGPTYVDNYFANDRGSAEAFGVNVVEPGNLTPFGTTGDSLSDLQMRTDFTNWSSEIWDLGTTSELPGLIIDGTVFRDGDADRILD